MKLSPLFRSRILRQSAALTRKNFLIFYKSPITTIFRALLFPVAVALVLCLLKNILATTSSTNYKSGIASSSRPLKDLASALDTDPALKLVFVRNGVSDVDSVINGVLEGIGSRSHVVLDDPNDLFNACPQTMDGTSNCFAAVIFTNSNSTNVGYIIAVDNNLEELETAKQDFEGHDSFSIDRLMPLKWAVDSIIGNFSVAPKPVELPHYGCGWEGVSTNFYSSYTSYNTWLGLVSTFVAPIFMLVFMGIVYHLSLSVGGERQSGISDLLAAQTCTIVPRILSNLVSFILLYLPGWIICSVLMTQILFTRTSDMLLLFLTILAGMALASASHLCASFFRKGQMAGLYTSTLMFALGFVTIAFVLNSNPSFLAIQVVTFIFPPITYVNLIGDVARAEVDSAGYSLAPNSTLLNPTNDRYFLYPYPEFAGYRYVIIFVLQISLFGLATYGVEKWLWTVKRNFTHLEAGSEITLRTTHLSKTFKGRRRWYWPFTVIPGSVVHAVDDFNIELKKGSVNFLLGPNGGGKTTTLKCIAGMHSMDSDSCLEISEDSLLFGVCPQLNVFWDTLTVAEHVKIWRSIKTAASESNLEDEEDILVECDLLDKLNCNAKNLSGGQQRKLQLAIAFVGGSKMCCIDEASSGLDPLSRRNIWNIISKGHSRRTVLMTTHFLDEADILADFIAILYKGRMVCAGTSTALKASHGDAYIIREVEEEGTVWSSPSSADATKKIMELEEISDASYSVQFPTLDQVFLKATDSTAHALHEEGDGVVTEINAPKELEEVESIHHENLNLDVGHTVGFFRQILVLLMKRYILIQHTWISFIISVAIPIIIAAALAKFMVKISPLTTCQKNFDNLHNLTSKDYTGYFSDVGSFVPLTPLVSEGYDGAGSWEYSTQSNLTIVGPESQFLGAAQTEIWLESTQALFGFNSYSNPGVIFNSTNQSLSTRQIASSLDGLVSLMSKDSTCQEGSLFGLFAPKPEQATIVHTIGYGFREFDNTIAGLGVITNRIANATTTNGRAKIVQTSVRKFRAVGSNHDFRILPIVLLLIIGLIASTSVAILYPTEERINNVRALQYCNGVSPAALWIAYLIYDMHALILGIVVTYACIFVGTGARLWYDSGYVFGVLLLFGIATYLGIYMLSFFIKKAAFAIAAGIHLVLFVLYFVSYVIIQSGSSKHKYNSYNQLQDGLGLTSPAANLARALFISSNNFDVLCGMTGVVIPKPGTFNLYSGVYVNLVVQILFLTGVIALLEYGSTEWFYRIIWKKRVPARLRYVIESGDAARGQSEIQEKTVPITTPSAGTSIPVLIVERVSKYFGKVFATENVSFNIASNEVLALIGPNGAGKTSMINMIRGILKPNYGDIHLDGVSVLSQAQRSRSRIGVCPQDDAIDELTARQTLNFFAAVKGLKDIRRNVDTIMTAFNIKEFENLPVKKLSGGTRRKLMVSIALLGNPHVLLLDEPSTGQDAGAKRILWKVLQSVSRNRAILLTTHSMEETEALATKVTILATRVLASGSLAGLRNEYGGKYRLRATYGEGVNEAEVARLLQERWGDAMSGLTVRYGEAEWELPHVTRNLGRIMEGMEEMVIGGEQIGVADGGENAAGGVSGGEGTGRSKGRLFSSYVVMEPTMEEVFMKVCQQASLIAPVES